MNILFYDLEKNGKDHHVVDVDLRYKIMNFDHQRLDGLDVRMVMFSANEDGMHYIKKINTTLEELQFEMIRIRNYILNKFPNVIIFNDPIHFDVIGDKLKTFKYLCDVVSCPKFSHTISKWKHFPAIVSANIASGGRRRFLCKTTKELSTNNRRIMCPTFVCSYVNSYVETLSCFSCLRLMVIDDKLVDWFFRPGDTWNIHNKTQDKFKMEEADEYFENWLASHRDVVDTFLSSTYKKFGHGAYAYDVILQNDTLVLCEVGYKFYDESYADVLKKTHKLTHKLTNNVSMYSEVLNNYIKNIS